MNEPCFFADTAKKQKKSNLLYTLFETPRGLAKKKWKKEQIIDGTGEVKRTQGQKIINGRFKKKWQRLNRHEGVDSFETHGIISLRLRSYCATCQLSPSILPPQPQILKTTNFTKIILTLYSLRFNLFVLILILVLRSFELKSNKQIETNQKKKN